jgi:hypothetical protein
MKALGYDMIVTAVEVPAALSVEFRGVCNKVLTGVTGKYFVAAELSRCGNIASITLRNTKGVDILCSNADASKSVGIEVKTLTAMHRSWILSQKGEHYYADQSGRRTSASVRIPDSSRTSQEVREGPLSDIAAHSW